MKSIIVLLVVWAVASAEGGGTITDKTITTLNHPTASAEDPDPNQEIKRLQTQGPTLSNNSWERPEILRAFFPSRLSLNPRQLLPELNLVAAESGTTIADRTLAEPTGAPEFKIMLSSAGLPISLSWSVVLSRKNPKLIPQCPSQLEFYNGHQT